MREIIIQVSEEKVILKNPTVSTMDLLTAIDFLERMVHKLTDIPISQIREDMDNARIAIMEDNQNDNSK